MNQTRELFFEFWGFSPPWRCWFCGKAITARKRTPGDRGESLDVHHVDADSKNNDPENLVPAHARCHLDYHRLPYDVTPFNDEDDG
jgi:HNH endonuclease